MATAKRLLVSSVDPDTPGGYGVQIKEFLPRLQAAGVETALFAFACGKDFYHVWHTDHGDIPVFPPIVRGATSSIVLGHAYYWQPDAVLSLMDPMGFDPDVYGKLHWIAWTPSDSEPVAPSNVTVLQAAKHIWSISKHGHEQLQKAGFEPDYVPLGIDTHVFTPMDRAVARRTLADTLRKEHGQGAVDLDGKFLVVMNAANLSRPCRKGFWEGFTAFKAFSDRHEDARLYVHSDVTGKIGESLDKWVTMVGLDPAKLWFAPVYPYMTGLLNQHWLNAMYNAADVFLLPSRGEGFGLPIVEAQAAGTPVIVTDFSSMPELTFAGWKVPIKTMVPALNVGCLHAMPDIAGIDAALEEAYKERHNTTLREQARAGALAYDAGRIMSEYLMPALNKAFAAAEVRRTVHAVEKPIETAVRDLHVNKVCNVEDFADPILADVIRTVYAHKRNGAADYPRGREERKAWEVALAYDTLRHALAGIAQLRVLGVGAGHEVTAYLLTSYAEVHATDLYAGAGMWHLDAPPDMLVDPARHAPPGLSWTPENLIVRHMDGRALAYPDGYFDAVFSSSSIEHFGSLADISQAAREIGRVLKPGGIASLSTEYKISGPDGGIGWDNVVVFDAEGLQQTIIEPSGLELIEPLETVVSEATLAAAVPLLTVLDHFQRGVEPPFPHIVMTHEGYTFTSVHLALRKPGRVNGPH